jgi:hypothetical protein
VEVGFEQCQVVEKLPGADESGLQSLSTAESPKQDRGERPSAKHSDITARVQRALSQKLDV